MGVSRRSDAAQRGVFEAAVRKTIATGRITTLPDGTIDPARADSELGAQTDPAKQCVQHAKQMGGGNGRRNSQGGGHQAVPQSARRADADTLKHGFSPRWRKGVQMGYSLQATSVSGSSKNHFRGDLLPANWSVSSWSLPLAFPCHPGRAALQQGPHQPLSRDAPPRRGHFQTGSGEPPSQHQGQAA